MCMVSEIQSRLWNHAIQVLTMLEEATLDSLCQTCENLFSEDASQAGKVCIKDGVLFLGHHRFASLLESARDGCHLCTLMESYLRTCKKKARPTECDQIWVVIQNEGFSSRQLQIFVGDEFRGYDRLAGFVSLNNIANTQADVWGEPISELLIERPTSFSTSSAKTFDQIWRWMATCDATHTECKPILNSPAFPRRLLDLGSVPSADYIRLRDMGDVQKPLKYMTLSYCWGRGLSVKLTTDSLDRFQQQIVVADLPQTFQDTVYVVRALGGRYLWIDALCIIQDSQSDWLNESAKMTEIYLNSDLSIAASTATDCHGGLFHSRNPLALTPCIIKTCWKSYREQQLFAFATLTSLGDLETFHLRTRAWTVQERLLAPRTVHFGETEIYWECASSVCRESYPEQVPLHRHQSLHSQGQVKKWLVGADRFDLDLDDKFELLRIWVNVVESYTMANLTFDTDKLVAIAGLARRINLLSDGGLGDYHAGLWMNNFLHQLLWHSDSSLEDDRSSQYLAPSWSWASCNKEVSFFGILARRLAWDDKPKSFTRLVEVTTRSLPDSFGAVEGGELVIQGRLCRAVAAGEMVTGYESDDETLYRRFDIKHVMIGGKILPVQKSLSDTYTNLCFDCYPISLEGAAVEESFWILPLFSLQKSSDPGREGFQFEIEMTGLMLRPTGLKKGQFMRIGLFQTSEKKYCEAILNSIDTYRAEEEFFVSFDDELGYVIEII